MISIWTEDAEPPITLFYGPFRTLNCIIYVLLIDGANIYFHSRITRPGDKGGRFYKELQLYTYSKNQQVEAHTEMIITLFAITMNFVSLYFGAISIHIEKYSYNSLTKLCWVTAELQNTPSNKDCTNQAPLMAPSWATASVLLVFLAAIRQTPPQ